MFRRLLKFRNESDLSNHQQNSHFPTTRIPLSATMNTSLNNPLNDTTNIKSNNLMMYGGGLRVAVNPYTKINEEFNESGFESHCDG